MGPSTYKLEPGDTLMIYPDDNNIYIIIEGILIINKLFSNNEKFSSDIIYKGHIIRDLFQKRNIYNYCNEITPLSTTYIMSISDRSPNLYKEFHKVSYVDTTVSKMSLLSLWTHKNIKHRIIHLLLILYEINGQSYRQSLTIDIKLSYKVVAIITGSTSSTVSSIIQKLQDDNIIIYTNQQIIIKNIFLLNAYTLGIIH
uniref:Global nitrogen transcriptional regulator n=1 Tax=Helminthora furcellata TaxID=1884666 RepID=A0A1G4NZI4_9FLOR|nr:Global nitrogen transcriptional regulator [Helminthora furcellata]SCW21230.1 Global nitrogen transcriptional regulator [Helminthora furcellata]SCW24090.1 Global nitrogen transcriptional regulator [Helminthora furcellata]